MILAVVATLTESLISKACFTASTYAFVAASCAPVGSVTFIILEVFTLTVPDPFGFNERAPLAFVVLISLPSKVKLSTLTTPDVNEVNPAIEDVVAPGFNALEPSVVAFTLTAPLDTEKSVESKDAPPLLPVVASSAAILIVLLLTVVSIPSPPVKFKVSLSKETASSEPLSAPTVKLEDTVAKLTAPLPFVISA